MSIGPGRPGRQVHSALLRDFTRTYRHYVNVNKLDKIGIFRFLATH